MAKNFTEQELITAAAYSRGVMASAASALNCDWTTAKKYIFANDAAREEFERQEARLVHDTAGKMFDAVDGGERWAIERILDTRGRRDGLALVNRTEISGPEGAPIASQSRVIEIDPAMLEAAVKDAAKLIAERQLALSEKNETKAD